MLELTNRTEIVEDTVGNRGDILAMLHGLGPLWSDVSVVLVHLPTNHHTPWVIWWVSYPDGAISPAVHGGAYWSGPDGAARELGKRAAQIGYSLQSDLRLATG